MINKYIILICQIVVLILKIMFVNCKIVVRTCEKYIRKKFLIILICFLFCFWGILSIKANNQVEPEIELGMVVVTPLKNLAHQTNVATNVIVITEQDIRQSGAKIVADVLEKIP